MSANRFAALAIDDEPKTAIKTSTKTTIKIASKPIEEKIDIKQRTYRKPTATGAKPSYASTATIAAKKDKKIPTLKAPSMDDAFLFPSLAPSTGSIEPIKELMITPKQAAFTAASKQSGQIASIASTANASTTKAPITTPTVLRIGNMHLKGSALAAYEDLRHLEDAIQPYVDAILEDHILVSSEETDFKSVDPAYDDFASMMKDYINARALYKTRHGTYPVSKHMRYVASFCFEENKRVGQGLKELKEAEQAFSSDSEIDE